MNKRNAASWAAFLVLAGFLLVTSLDATTYAKVFSQWMQSSLVDSTPIGSTTPSTGAFTNLSANGTLTLSGISAIAATPLCTSNSGGNVNNCAAYVPRTCNGNGCYEVLPDGTYIESGISPAATLACSGVCATSTITWPHAFPTAVQVFVPQAIGCAISPCGSGAHPLSVVTNSQGTSSGNLYFDASGQSITVPSVQAFWIAIGN